MNQIARQGLVTHQVLKLATRRNQLVLLETLCDDEEPLTVLARWMSERQRLNAPQVVLNSFSGARDLLSSEGLIVRFQNHINFFHESLFDYLGNVINFYFPWKGIYEMKHMMWEFDPEKEAEESS